MTVAVMDHQCSTLANRRTDDGNDYSIVSSKFAKKAVLNEIGKLHMINPVTLQVSLKRARPLNLFRSQKLGLHPSFHVFGSRAVSTYKHLIFSGG